MPRIGLETINLGVPLAVVILAVATAGALAAPAVPDNRAPQVATERGKPTLIAQAKKKAKKQQQQNQRQGAPPAGGRDERGS